MPSSPPCSWCSPTRNGATGPDYHPFEETYFFLEGEAEATFDGKPVVLGAGDIAWAGVGLPALLPQPWRWAAPVAGDPGAAAAAAVLLPVRSRLGLPTRGARMTQSLLIVGGTHGIGKEIARLYAGQGWSVVLTGRDGFSCQVGGQ